MNSTAEVLAVIPARSGSKGVPNKNVRLLAGYPLIYWAIQHARNSRLIDRVVFSSDSENFCKLARQFGAEAPFLRPDHLSDDRAVDVDVLLHAVTWLKANEDYIPTHVVRLQPTNPTFTHELIDECITKLISDPDLDSLRPITRTPKHPNKMWVRNIDGVTMTPFMMREGIDSFEAANQSRHELPDVYVHVGTCDVLRIDTLLKERSMTGSRVGYLEISEPLFTPNIDTYFDFLVAEQAVLELGLLREKKRPEIWKA